MARGKAKDRDVEHLRQSVASFGFTVVARGCRVFILWPDATEVYICRKLPRPGFWELNRVDRQLWELHGAVGIPVFEYISIIELITWFYELALQNPIIMEGLKLHAKDAGNLKTNAERIAARGRPRDLKHEYALARKRKRNKMIQTAEENAKKRQDTIRARVERDSQTDNSNGKRQRKS